ncbi:MAG: hypothetical protein PHF21_03295 [Bacilli bacterium]|nr:hypothetical protein [Bacilli bacterium]
MSVKFVIDDKILSFKEFILSESIVPKQTKFGTNYPYFDNNEIYSFKGINSTWCVIDKSLYWIWIDNTNEVSFMKCKTPVLDNTDFILKQIYKIPTEYFMGTAEASYNAMNLFGNIFFVILQLADILQINSISFKGFSNNLDKFYSILVQNKLFASKVKEYNWQYSGIEDEKYIFIKIK